jgi:hypothetical protein
MNATEIRISRQEIRIEPQEIFQLMGGGESGDEGLALELIRTATEHCLQLMDPRAGFRTLKAEEAGTEGWIATGGLRFQTGKVLPRMLRNSSHYTFFLATAGPGPEEYSRDLMERGDYPAGYVSDLVASVIADQVCDQVHNHVMALAREKGLDASNRYSPGYCGWEVEEQQGLFSLVPEGFGGVSLSESSLLSPIKSVSGLIGSGPGVRFRDYTCELCSFEDCHFRKTRPVTS